jgi:hypothetical protein
MRRVRWLAVLVAVLAWAPATATARRHAPKPVALTAHFTRSGSPVTSVAATAGWVVLAREGALTLIDAITSTKTTVALPAGCFFQDASRTQLLLDCSTTAGQGAELEDIATGQARPVDLNPMFDCGAGTVESCAGPSSIGNDWMAVVGECEIAEHCTTSTSFQNLSTGQVLSDPTSHTVVPDLDTPTLARTLCSPVTVPTQSPGNGLPGFGSVKMDGRFAIGTGDGGDYLQECAVRLDRHLTFLGGSTAFNRHAVVWQSKPTRLTGLFLPSLTSFTIAIPPKVDPNAAGKQFVREDPDDLALSERTLYVANAGRVWTMPMPARPPKVGRAGRS